MLHGVGGWVCVCLCQALRQLSPCCVIQLVFLQGEETHVGVNFTAIGPPSLCIEHMLCHVFVWVWTITVIGQRPPELSLLGETHGFIVAYFGPPFPGGNNYSLNGLASMVSYPVINHAQWKTLCFNVNTIGFVSLYVCRVYDPLVASCATVH